MALIFSLKIYISANNLLKIPWLSNVVCFCNELLMVKASVGTKLVLFTYVTLTMYDVLQYQVHNINQVV